MSETLLANSASQALPPDYMLRKFRVEEEIGAGGFGVTYRAYDTELQRHVAVKEYFPFNLATRDSTYCVRPKTRVSQDVEEYQWGLRGFVTEARSLALFDHPNIIRVIDSFEENETAYIVMEYARGRDLSALLSQGLLSVEQTAAIVLPIIRGLGVVHTAQLLHRDIKPGNIIIREDGNPVLIDFGAARHAIGVRSRSISTILTPGYAPIEQYSSRGNQGPWTDIYALSAVAYVCLTGENLSHYEATERIRSDDLPPLGQRIEHRDSAFLNAIDWGLCPEEQDRPQSVATWLEAFETGGQNSSRGHTQAPHRPVTGSAPPGISAPTRAQSAQHRAETIGTGGSRTGFSRTGLVALALSMAVGLVFLYLAQDGPGPATARPEPTVDVPLRSTTGDQVATPSSPTQEEQAESATGAPAAPTPAPRRESSPRDEPDFALAQRIDTREAYELYLRLHPNGQHIDEAAAARRNRP